MYCVMCPLFPGRILQEATKPFGFVRFSFWGFSCLSEFLCLS